MRYYTGDETPAQARTLPRYYGKLRHNSLAAEAAAEHEWTHCNGWESTWPKHVTLLADDGTTSRWIIHVGIDVPTFDAYKGEHDPTLSARLRHAIAQLQTAADRMAGALEVYPGSLASATDYQADCALALLVDQTRAAILERIERWTRPTD